MRKTIMVEKKIIPYRLVWCVSAKLAKSLTSVCEQTSFRKVFNFAWTHEKIQL